MGRTARQAEKRFKKHVPELKLNAQPRMAAHPVETSVQDRIYSASQTEMRRCIDNGDCPFCGRKFKNLALHTNKAHGVSCDELKDMAGIPHYKPVCSPEHSAACADRATKFDPEHIRKLRPKTKRRLISPAARKSFRQNALKQSPENRALGAQRNKDRHLNATADRDDEVVRLIRGGALAIEAAEAVGIHKDTVRQILKRRGVDMNLRQLRMRRPEIRDKAVAAMNKGQGNGR